MVRNFRALVAGLILGLAAVAGAAPEAAQRSAALLAYIAADYELAVADGAVINRVEFDEQVEFVGAAETLLADLAPPEQVGQGLGALREAILALRPAPEVAALARRVRAELVSIYGIAQAPTRPPDAARGATLFAEHCSSCHGVDGAGDTPVAAAFAIPPPDLRDAAGAAGRSPFGSYNAITFGIDGTPMAPQAHLTEAERWDLAFHVQALAHGGPAPEVAAPRERAPALGLAELSSSSDGELRGRLGEEREEVLRWLRVAAPYRAAEGGSARALAFLEEVESALAAGDREAARIASIDAYLEGFEPMEARVAAVDGALVTEAEVRFARLRAAVEAGEGTRDALAELRAWLARIDGVLEQGGSSGGLFVASAAILLREGLEVVLLVGVLLSLLRRMGRVEMTRWVHVGWIAALAAGGVTWILAGQLFAFSGRARELLEGVVALLAAAVLLTVSHGFLSAAEKRRWLGFLREKLERHAGAWPLFGLSFLAVYREAFETVLFYQALLLDSPAGGPAILGGLAAGVAGVGIFGLLILRAGRRLPMGPLFGGSGVILSVLGIAFVGQGLQALREAGVMMPRPLDLPALPWLGFFPDMVGLLVQGGVALLLAALLLVPRLGGSGGVARQRPLPR